MSPQASPIVKVKKKHTPKGLPQQICLCIDYRKLNSLLLAVTPAMGTKKGTLACIPLSKIDELLALLKRAKYFIARDLWSGYYHIKLNQKSIPKCAFTTVFGIFKFQRLPFGLSRGPDFFIHLLYDHFGLDKTSTQGQGSWYLVYLHNIFVDSRAEKNTCKC